MQFEFISAVHKTIKSIIDDLNKQTDIETLATEVKKLFRNKLMDKNAVKNILLKEIKRNDKTFVDYYKHLDEDVDFWQIKFDDGKEFSPQSLPREPAYMFLKMVQGMCEHNNEEASIIGRTFLETLPDENLLKPKVWAQHKTDPKLFGVSLGVRSFVRPLFLCIKLTKLSTNKVTGAQLKDVNAFTMMRCSANHPREVILNKEVKSPSMNCQIFLSSEFDDFPLGNCAEYDVIGVKKNLEQTKPWETFRSRCKRHFDAFKKLEQEQDSSGEIVETYFNEMRQPEKKPKVLKYRTVSDEEKLITGFQLYATEDYPESKK